MNADEFKRRTKAYAIRVVRLAESLPKSGSAAVIGRQLLRAGTSVGANYRSVCRAKSRADFVAKLTIVEEECDESLYWMELLIETNVVKADLVADLMKEGNELLAMTVASARSARFRNNPQSAIANPK
ncbi:MAG: four helix bundle protein [Verrucomicrobia bacterium]|nr:four helix bundle protein [Verrucomicrobiota bacterium]